ncbi:MAG: hypothetical protein ACE5D3_06685 [Candidatus Binatia bacterium]
MNLISFLDELVKLGGVRCVIKRASDVNTVDIPSGMVDDSPVPFHIDVWPHEAATRLPKTGKHLSSVPTGELGGVTQAKDPIDRDKYNRAYKDRR